MDIGTEHEEVVIEPIEDPRPDETPAPWQPEEEPVKAPVEEPAPA
jgi:hypothetical protein